MLRTAIRAALLTAVAGGLACTQAVDTSLLHIPPPDSWVEDLAIARDDRDAYFGTSAETPLLAEDREGFDGLDYWEPDPDYYLVGSVRFYADAERVQGPQATATVGVARLASALVEFDRAVVIGLDADQGRPLYERIADAAAKEIGWSDEERESQLEALREYSDSLKVVRPGGS